MLSYKGISPSLVPFFLLNLQTLSVETLSLSILVDYHMHEKISILNIQFQYHILPYEFKDLLHGFEALSLSMLFLIFLGLSSIRLSLLFS